MKNSTLNNTIATSTRPTKTFRFASLQATAKRFALMAFSALSLSLLITSCKSELQPTPNSEPNSTPVRISLNASPLLAVGTSTKAATDLALPAEQHIYNLWVVQFDKGTGARVGNPSYQTIANGIQVGAVLDLEVSVTAAASPQVFYFIANTNDANLLTGSASATISALNNTAITLASEFLPNATTLGIPMLGSKEWASISANMALSGVTVDRMVAKVQFQYKVNSTFSDLTVTSVQLHNVPKSMYLQTQPALPAAYPAIASGFFDISAENPATATTIAGGYSQFTWYVPENLREVKSAAAIPLASTDRILSNTEDGMVTWVEIKGKTADMFVSYAVLLGETTANGNDFNLKRNNIYTAVFDITSANIADSRIIANRIQANSFMIPPGGNITFDAGIRGNESVVSLAPQSMAIVWQDNANLLRATNVAYNSSTRICTVSPVVGQSGNALVAAYDGPNGTGNILWSWHIWATDYQPSEVGTAVRTTNTAYPVTGGQVHTYGTSFLAANGSSRTIMDRNLGATKGYNTTVPIAETDADGTYGLLYQWGRKDPLPHAITVLSTTAFIPLYDAVGTQIATASAPVKVTGTSTVATSILTPTTIYGNSVSPYDWLTSRDNTLWLPTTKTLYDPCPKGWHVPPTGTWSDFTRTDATTGTCLWYNSGVLNTGTETSGVQNGRRYTAGTVNAWYPATGCWDPTTGLRLRSTGVYQAIYSSDVVSGMVSPAFVFNQTTLTVSQNFQRGYGLPLRCVQE